MKKVVALAALLTISLAAVATDAGQVAYLGGTVPAVKEGTVGKLDTAQQEALSFEHSGGKVAIPFANIDSYEYTEKRARHLGVLPFIAVGLFKHLQRRHFFRISYHDEANVAQVVIFEVPKEMPSTLLAVLQTRAPLDCKGSGDAHELFSFASVTCRKAAPKPQASGSESSWHQPDRKEEISRQP